MITMRIAAALSLSISILAGCGGAANTANTAGNQPVNAASPAQPLNITTRTVSITSSDNTILVGTFAESSQPNSPALLMLHQWQSDRHSYDDFAKRMQAKGFSVLSIDGRGFGESTKTTEGRRVEPSRSDDTVKAMLGDVNAAFDFLSKQKNVDPSRIGIVGASYGSSLAIIYGASNPKVKAIALLSPGLNYFGSMQTEPAIRKYGDRPLLMVAAEDDKESADAVRQLKKYGTSDKHQIQIYEKGGHGTGLFGAKAGLEDLLDTFLSKSL